MRKALTTAGTLVALVAVAAIAAGCAETTTSSHADVDTTPSSSSSSSPAAEPDGKFTSSCDISLPDDPINGTYYFVGAAKLHNTGNIGIKVRVRARWDQVADANVTATKTVRLKRGHSRAVKFKVPVTQNQVQQLQDSPDYMNDGGCKVRVKIVNTFGRAA